MMTRRALTFVLPATLATLLIVAGTAPAQERDRQQDRQRDQQRDQQSDRQRDRQGEDESARDRNRNNQDRQDRQRRQDERKRSGRSNRGQITGQVVQTKRVDIRGTDRQHLVVLLETESGKRVAVDLGRPENLKKAPVKTGDRLTVGGRLVQIGERQLVIGEQVKAKGDTFAIRRDTRDMPNRRPMRPRRPMHRMARIQGEIAKLKKVSLPGTDLEVVLALLETRGGRGDVVASLGAEKTLSQVDLNEGDKIAIMGEFVRVGDRPFLVANRVWKADGVRLEHPRTSRRSGSEEQRRSGSEDRPRTFQGGDRQDHQVGNERPAGLGVALVSDGEEGVRVVRVFPGSPADDAGIRSGDRIILVGENYVDQPRALIDAIAGKEPGDRVSITIQRDGDEQRVTTTLVSRREALNEIDRMRRALRPPNRRDR